MSTPGNTIPVQYQNANPLLYTFRDYHVGIQPYFIIVTQFFFYDISLRLWDRVVYGTWKRPSDFIGLEYIKSLPPPFSLLSRHFSPSSDTPRASRVRTIYLLQPLKGPSLKIDKPKKAPTFDLFDVLFSSLPLIAHTAWYCYIQASCSSGANATTWNCYNLFGYRIYNYLFAPFANLIYEYTSKWLLFPIAMEQQKILNERRKRWQQIWANVSLYLSLVVSTIALLFAGALILPYIFTNALPMVIVYSFIVVIYAYIVVIASMLFEFYHFVTGKWINFEEDAIGWIKRQLRKVHIKIKRRLVVHFGIRLFSLLITILFNLSQYFYYGEDYIGSLNREAASRDPDAYFDQVSNTTEIAHTILSTI